MSEPVGVSGNQLRAIIERIEHVEEEIKALTEAKREIYQEAKGQRVRRQNHSRNDSAAQTRPEGARRAGDAA